MGHSHGNSKPKKKRTVKLPKGVVLEDLLAALQKAKEQGGRGPKKQEAKEVKEVKPEETAEIEKEETAETMEQNDVEMDGEEGSKSPQPETSGPKKVLHSAKRKAQARKEKKRLQKEKRKEKIAGFVAKKYLQLSGGKVHKSGVYEV